MEIWKDVYGFEGYYKVSNYGNILSVERVVIASGYQRTFERRISERLLKPKTGTGVVTLVKDGKKRHVTVARIVAETFISRPVDMTHVIHKDKDLLNNRVENLEWAAMSSCANHYLYQKRGPRSRKHPVKILRERAGNPNISELNKKRCKPVQQLDFVTGEVIATFPSVKEAATAIGVSSNCISSCVRGLLYSSGGFGWKFVSDTFVRKQKQNGAGISGMSTIRKGQQYRNWTVLSSAGCDKHKHSTWRCLCSCGNVCVISFYTLTKSRRNRCKACS